MSPRSLSWLGVGATTLALMATTGVSGYRQADGRTGAAKLACGELTTLRFEGNASIASAAIVPAGDFVTPGGQTLTRLPAFCRAIGVSKPTADSHISFEVWLPTDTWNGRFLSSGEGGYAGTLNYTRSGLDGGLDELIRRGYATASTDTGHLS